MQHWKRLVERWEHLGSPLRPSDDDIHNYSALLNLKQLGAQNVLILGVTPEIYRLGWPYGEVATVDSYRDSHDTYHFLTEEHSIATLVGDGRLSFQERREGTYALADRFPVLLFRKEPL